MSKPTNYSTGSGMIAGPVGLGVGGVFGGIVGKVAGGIRALWIVNEINQ